MRWTVTFSTTLGRVVTSRPDRKDARCCLADADGLKGVCVVPNAGEARTGERSVLRGRHHVDLARVATQQFLRGLLDQYRGRYDWPMVSRPPPGAARRIPLARRTLLHLFWGGGHGG